MSNAHALAAVTQVLVKLLDESLKAAQLSDLVGGDVLVSALPPPRIELGEESDPNQLNVFLYLVQPNHGAGGHALPTRDSSGRRVANTPLALDLYYLLTAYGSATGFSEMILGHGMQVLHECAVLPRELVRARLQPSANPDNAELALAASGLADQIELIKLSPEKITTEELARLWSALGAEYRPTVAYRVTVVLIESDASTKAPLPALRAGVYNPSLASPRIDRLASRPTAANPARSDQPILAGHQLVLLGKRLQADSPRFVLDGETLDPPDAVYTSASASFTLPATLRAGPHGIRVVHELLLGDPATPHRGFSSNDVSFLLRPRIKSAPTVSAAQKRITIKVEPAVSPAQKVRLFLDELQPAPGQAPRSFSFPAPVNNGVDVENAETETDTLRFTYPADLPAADYLVRVQVDGAESLPESDLNGVFAKPKATVP
jgi:hypothetical protein